MAVTGMCAIRIHSFDAEKFPAPRAGFVILWNRNEQADMLQPGFILAPPSSVKLGNKGYCLYAARFELSKRTLAMFIQETTSPLV